MGRCSSEYNLYKVNGKSIVGAEMDFTLEEFKSNYKVYKREKPVVVREENDHV